MWRVRAILHLLLGAVVLAGAATEPSARPPRAALLRDVDKIVGGVRDSIGDVNKTLENTRTTAVDLGGAVGGTRELTHSSITDVVDHAYRRALVLLLVALLGVPAAAVLYRLAIIRFAGASKSGDASADPPCRAAAGRRSLLSADRAPSVQSVEHP